MRKNTTTGLVIHCKERVYVVDSDASLHMMGPSSLNHDEKEAIRHSSKVLDIQPANGILVSDTQAKVCTKEVGADLWVSPVKESPSVLSL